MIHTKLKPKKCCHAGDYTCQIPMPIRGRSCFIDICIADIVSALNAAGTETIASCCGHGSDCASIVLGDGRELLILPELTLEQRNKTSMLLEKILPNFNIKQAV